MACPRLRGKPGGFNDMWLCAVHAKLRYYLYAKPYTLL